MSDVREYSRGLIEEIAKTVRDGLQLSVPVDINKAVNDLGGECVPVSDVEYDAKIEILGETEKISGFKIKYAQGQSERRIRFSIAHELGHLFLHMLRSEGEYSKNIYFRGKNTENARKEWEANDFAASFLMPEEEFVSFCIKERNDKNGVNINSIAEHFKVSKQAAFVRGEVLGLW